MIYDFKFITTDSSDPKTNISFLDEMILTLIHQVKEQKTKIFWKNSFSKRTLFASGLVFLPDDPNDLRDRVRLTIQKKKEEMMVIN